jgi:urease accessory protein
LGLRDFLSLEGSDVTTRCRDIPSAMVACGFALTLCPIPAHAHLIETGLGPVYDGIIHFALTAEDLLPTLALAVLAGLRGKHHARYVIFVFPLAWLLAGVFGASANVTPTNSLSWVALLVLGGLVAADLWLPVAATALIAAILGLFLGFANGYEMAQAGLGLRAAGGSVGAAFMVMTLGSACAVAWQSGWVRIAWRVAGSWIAASGLLILSWSLR